MIAARPAPLELHYGTHAIPTPRVSEYTLLRDHPATRHLQSCSLQSAPAPRAALHLPPPSHRPATALSSHRRRRPRPRSTPSCCHPGTTHDQGTQNVRPVPTYSDKPPRRPSRFPTPPLLLTHRSIPLLASIPSVSPTGCSPTHAHSHIHLGLALWHCYRPSLPASSLSSRLAPSPRLTLLLAHPHLMPYIAHPLVRQQRNTPSPVAPCDT